MRKRGLLQQPPSSAPELRFTSIWTLAGSDGKSLRRVLDMGLSHRIRLLRTLCILDRSHGSWPARAVVALHRYTGAKKNTHSRYLPWVSI